MKLTAIDHVSLGVSDLDIALNFYCGVLGLKIAPRPDMGFPGAWLTLGDAQVHLLERGIPKPDPGQHFAIRVDDLDSVVAEVRSCGVTVSDAVALPSGARQAFFQDPDGYVLEVQERH